MDRGAILRFACLALPLLVLLFVMDGFRRDALMIALTFAVCAGAYDVSAGFAGMRSLGPIIPFGIGAYVHALFVSHGHPFLVAIAFAGLIAGVVGAVLTAVVLGNRRGVAPWMIVGLILSIALEQLARANTDVLGGSNGLVIRRYFANGMDIKVQETLFAAFLFVATCIIFYVLQRSVSEERGARLLVASNNPDRLSALGLSLRRTRIENVVLVWTITGFAGSMYCALVGTIDPSVFGLANNLTILIAAISIGERTVLRASIVAGVLVFSDNLLGSAAGGYQTAILGLGLIVVLLIRQQLPKSRKVLPLSMGTHGLRIL